MKLNLGKCSSLCFSKGSPRDPNVFIDGNKIPYMGDEPVRFLGKLIYKKVKDTEARQMIETKLTDMLNMVHNVKLSGPAKAWIYCNYILAKLSWDLTIYELPISFIQHLDDTLPQGILRNGLVLIEILTEVPSTAVENTKDFKSPH